MSNSYRLKKQKGSTLIFVTLVVPVILAFVGMGIDLGVLMVVKNQLQMTADAAALAGVADVSSSSQAISVAQQYANLNHPNHGTVLASSDVLIGTWNTSNNTFTSTSSNPNALQVTVRRTKASGNAVTLYFMPIVSITTADLTATATAYQTYPPFNYGIVGLNSITMSGATYIDSYNSAQGTYNSQTATHNGNIVSNGSISLSGSATVYGNANPGPGQSISIIGGSSVTGSTTALSQAVSFPSISAPQTYNNHGLGSSLTIGGGNTVSLTPDTYYFSSVSLSNGGVLNLTGNTTIYISGSFSIQGGATVNNGQNPSELTILLTSTGTTVDLSNGSAFYGFIYAPSATLTFQGGSGYYGGFVGKTVTVSNGAAIHRDTSLVEKFTNPVIKLAK